jgi:hypothetical protein
MDGDPLDLDADRPALSREDATLVAAFRAGLEPDEGQTRRVISRLPLIQAQARRSHRRRQVLAAGVAVVAVAAATALVSALPATSTAGLATPAGTTSAATPKPTMTSLPPIVLLPTQSVTLFDDARLKQVEGPAELGGQDLIAGVCVDTALSVRAPEFGWQTAWSVTDSAATVPPGLVEKVWVWADTAPASALFGQLEQQVAGCSAGPGLEGRGVTRRLDAPAELSRADRVLMTAASDGQGNQAVQVVMLAGRLVVQLDAVILPAGKEGKETGELSQWTAWSIADTARAALTRAIEVTQDAAR